MQPFSEFMSDATVLLAAAQQRVSCYGMGVDRERPFCAEGGGPVRARGLKAPEWKDAGRRAIGPETVTTGGNGQSILKAIGAFAVSEFRPDDSIRTRTKSSNRCWPK